MDDPLTTDQILDVYDHLEKTDKSMPQLLADHGVQDLQMQRAAGVLVKNGEGRAEAFSIGLAIGLQLGAMRMPPIEYVPEPEDATKKQCNCLLCQIERAVQEGD